MCENLGDLYKLATEHMQDAGLMPRGEARQKCYTEARNLMGRALNMIESLSIFSDNETLDDIATENIKYLLIPAYLAKVILSSECRQDRLKDIKSAESYLKLFFRNIINYGLGDRTIEEAISNDAREPAAVSTASSLELAAVRRNQKIERYKSMKLLENQLNELSHKIESSASVDDEVVREYYINLVKKWISDSLDSLELEVKPAIFFEQNRPSPDPIAGHSDQKHPTTTTKNKTTPQTLTLVKDNLQKQVFGVGYPSRPTVTVDEFISKKIKDGDLAFTAHKEVYTNSLQRYAEEPNLRREQDEMIDIEQEEKNERDDDEELRRKRQWDEFKDETPRGSGNRHNMG